MELYAEKVNKEGFARLPRLSLSVTSSLVFLLFGESEVYMPELHSSLFVLEFFLSVFVMFD